MQGQIVWLVLVFPFFRPHVDTQICKVKLKKKKDNVWYCSIWSF